MGERSGWDGSPTAGAGGVEAASFGRVRRSGVFKRKTLGPGLSFVHCFFQIAPSRRDLSPTHSRLALHSSPAGPHTHTPSFARPPSSTGSPPQE